MTERTVTVFYHGDCQDGFGAAWCAWRRFGESADYIPMHYGDPWPAALIAGREVFVLDFSADFATLRELAACAGSLLLLDHHATPCREWEHLLKPDPERGLRRYDDPELALTVAFDMNRSGARLAWDWFFPGQPLPRLLGHVEDQDLWRFRLPDTRAYCRALRCRPFDFLQWTALVDDAGLIDAPPGPGYAHMLLEGGAIEEFFLYEVAQMAAGPAMTVRLRGGPAVGDASGCRCTVDGLCINASALFASELGEALARRSGSFGMTWYLRSDGRVKVSLRAAGAVNVATIAEQYGGGGHPNAAGITFTLADFLHQVIESAPPGQDCAGVPA